MNQRKQRYKGMRTRLALVVVGLALGFAARWIGGLLESNDSESNFVPMPEITVNSSAAKPVDETAHQETSREAN